jgi:prepilin-type N-terminal cleavage/methylation domain-containing protein
MHGLKEKLGEKGYTLMEVLIVATIIGILLTVGTTSYIEAKWRSKEKLAAGRLAQLAAYERMYFRDFGEYADFLTLRDDGYIDWDYIHEDDEPLHFHRPVYIPEYTLEFELTEENAGFIITAEPVLTEEHLWYPRWYALGGISYLRSMYVDQDGVVRWLDTDRPIY